MRAGLIVALIFLALASWVNDIAAADAVMVFAAFVIGGLWCKYSDPKG